MHFVQPELTLCDSYTVFSAVSSLSHSDAQVPDNRIVGVAETPPIPVYCDTIARCCLPKDRHAFGYDHTLFNLNQTTYREHDYAVALRNALAERPFTAIIEICHNIDGATTTADSVSPKTFCARKSESGDGGY